MQSARRSPSSRVHTQLTIFPGNLAVSMSVPGAPPLSGFATSPLEGCFVHPGADLGQERRGGIGEWSDLFSLSRGCRHEVPRRAGLPKNFFQQRQLLGSFAWTSQTPASSQTLNLPQEKSIHTVPSPLDMESSRICICLSCHRGWCACHYKCKLARLLPLAVQK